MPRARVGTLELHYESIGDGDPIVLVMGVGAQLVHWPDAFCHALAERGFRVIRFDNRDVGESTRLDHLGVPPIRRMMVRSTIGLPVDPPYGLEDMADDVASLLDALGIPAAHVVGASMGGMIAQLVTLRHPHRVLSLTSIMSHPGDRWSRIPTVRALRALMKPAPRTRHEAERAHLEFLRVVGSRGIHRDDAAARRRAVLSFDRGLSPGGFMRHMAAILAAEDRRPHLRRVDVPALVIHGSIDPLVRPVGGIQTAAAIPGSRFLLIENMGHDLPEGAWPRIHGAIGEVARHTSKRSARP